MDEAEAIADNTHTGNGTGNENENDADNNSTITSKPRVVLVAEDSPSQLKELVKAFQGQGFVVKSFPNGYAALEYFEGHSEEIDLVVTDKRMKGLDGEALSLKIRESRPNLPIVVVSAECNVRSVALLAKKQIGYVQKGFSSSQEIVACILRDFYRMPKP